MPIYSIDDRQIIATTDEGRPWNVWRVTGNLLDMTPGDFPGLLGNTGGPETKRAVIIDKRVLSTYPQLEGLFSQYNVRPVWIQISGGEQTKTAETVLSIVDELGTIDPVRGTPVYAVGGGAVTDAARLAIAWFDRGHPAISIPTTLVGLGDAGFASKTGINVGEAKHLIGGYDPPALTLLWPGWLKTLGPEHIAYGLAEIAKTVLATSADMWELFTGNVDSLIDEAFQSEAAIRLLWHDVLALFRELNANERERLLFRWADLGHTLTHAGEMRGAWHHGRGVACDMAVFAVLSAMRERLPWKEADAVVAGLARLRFPLWSPLLADGDFIERCLDATARHRGGQQHIPLLVRIGECEFVSNVTTDEVLAAAQKVAEMTGAEKWA